MLRPGNTEMKGCVFPAFKKPASIEVSGILIKSGHKQVTENPVCTTNMCH